MVGEGDRSLIFFRVVWDVVDVRLIGEADDAGSGNAAGGYLNLKQELCLLSGQVTTYNIRVGADGYVMVAIYSDNSGEPGSLLASTSSTAVTTGVNSIAIGPVSVVKDAYYWLAYNSDASIVLRRRKTDSQVLRAKSATYSGFVFPDPAGSGYTSSTTYARIISAWGTEAAAGCPRQAMFFKMMG